MSSDLCTEGRGEDTGIEKKKKDGVETEEVEKEVCFSPGHRGTQEVTSEGGLEQVQREEMLRKKVSHVSVNQEGRAAGSGACPGGVSLCSCPDKDREGHRDEPRGPGPFYFLGGTNGAEIVSGYFESRGWKRIYNKHREDFRLKWCETKSPANYCNFREGKQLLYQIPNNKVLTTKIGLLSSLREYERVSCKVTHGQGLRRLKMEEFIPTTFRLDVREEREAFFAKQEGERDDKSLMWICKPTGLNQGRGIFLLKSQEDVTALRLKLQHMDDSHDKKLHHCPAQARIVQHYIQNPLLLKGKKFDVRSYLLIACTAPYLVFFRHGYVRLTCDLYDPSSNNLSAHLTNQYMQKKNPLYSQLKEDTVWSMESFNAYINDCFGLAKGLPRDWVLGAFTRHMQRIMTQCFFAVKAKLECRLGFFDLIGCDFMVDEDFKVWLLEMNCNPALHTNCEVLREVIPSTVVEMLDLTLEIFNKRRLGQRILPLASQREFVLLHNGVLPADSTVTGNKNDSERLKKPNNKTQKAKPRRCKSGVEGKNGSTASTDNCLNVTEVGAGRGSSRFRHHLTSASPSVQRASDSQSVRSKDLRLQLKMRKSTTQATGEEKTQQNMRVIVSLSSSELSEGASVCGSQETTACAPLTGLPVREDKSERGEDPGEEELGKSLVLD